jgi:Zn-finger nucleic acid-binding protein
MQCPVCKLDQVIVEYQGLELDLCINGCGTWFDADELRQLFESIEARAELQDLEQRLEELPRAERGPTRRCPRCRGRMRRVRAPGSGGVILDRCRRGHGLWFDPGELEEILSVSLDARDGALTRVQEFLGQFRRAAENHAVSPRDAKE